MIVLHYLNNSRAQRILWMLEELELPYEIKYYQRGANMLAPESLKKVHPLGKSPVITDDGLTIAESGAILEYLQETYDAHGKFKPAEKAEKIQYRYWLHFAEGSLMPLLLLGIVFEQLGKSPVPWIFRPIGKAVGLGFEKNFLNQQRTTQLRFIDSHLRESEWFAGEAFSAADIQMSFPLDVLEKQGKLTAYPSIQNWLNNIRQRPAFIRATARSEE